MQGNILMQNSVRKSHRMNRRLRAVTYFVLLSMLFAAPALVGCNRQEPEGASGTELSEQEREKHEYPSEYYAGTGQWDKAYQALKMDIEKRRHRDTLSLIMAVSCLVVTALLVVLIVMMRRMAVRREERIMQRFVDLRFKSLRARITPHFIYNALNHEIAACMAGAPSTLDRLVRLLHHQQFMADELWVPLESDISFVSDYVSIEKEAMDAPLDFTVEIDDSIDPETRRVPSMIIQILVENAFKHGFSTLPPDCVRILRISITERDDEMVIEVCNNAGDREPRLCETSCQGLKIIDGTLQFLNGKRRKTITFDTGEWTDNPQRRGFRAVLKIPDNFKQID